MRRAIVIMGIVMGFSFIQAHAQKQKTDSNSHEIRTLTGNNNISNGFYAGINLGYSPIAHKYAALTGVRLAWIMNHSLAVGISGTVFITDLNHNNITNDDFSLAGGYGGLYLEPIFFAKNPIHFSIPLTIGMGGIYGWDETFYIDSWNNKRYDLHEDWDTFFVIEPGLELDMNVVRFMRLSLGVTYRMTGDIYMRSVENITINENALRKISGYFSIKFGKF